MFELKGFDKPRLDLIFNSLEIRVLKKFTKSSRRYRKSGYIPQPSTIIRLSNVDRYRYVMVNGFLPIWISRGGVGCLLSAVDKDEIYHLDLDRIPRQVYSELFSSTIAKRPLSSALQFVAAGNIENFLNLIIDGSLDQLLLSYCSSEELSDLLQGQGSLDLGNSTIYEVHPGLSKSSHCETLIDYYFHSTRGLSLAQRN
ncbi:hypothetical protein [Pseudobacteriovorax antillogorgiicola]|uniref:Uncharacterized protein n=1 Tax=Pseudobacteriovorax antillogorgiicola TaxID=1513793 RepID=A0A1Y6BV18_9BACT|nr:hypothetical protein [Pseudobacteriovorax antillogorgiicola]TCS53026.1 hypothetical protein EDD56_10877 [Pseudobacteriovorax antillogorgiicola]SMF26822.1 hypothetical protein SAMN06296036_108170 [Pseudobacteriovorax antillogorgiicola]